MARRKIPEEKKKQNINATIDPEIYKLLDEYLLEKEIYNKSKYIEDLIKEDLIKNKKI
jgi:metal-responsive CopG/Arc/MetJ family transcriptional regulator